MAQEGKYLRAAQIYIFIPFLLYENYKTREENIPTMDPG